MSTAPVQVTFAMRLTMVESLDRALARLRGGKHRAHVPADSTSLASIPYVVRHGLGRHRWMGHAS